MVKENEITGVVNSKDGEVITFSMKKEDLYDFCLISGNIYKPLEKMKKSEVLVENGLIFGKTNKNNEVLICCNYDNLYFYGAQHLRTWAYFFGHTQYSKNKIEKFKEIKFKGGFLNYLFNIDGMDISYEGDKKIISVKDDILTYEINTEKYSFKISIGSVINDSTGIKGSSIRNDEVWLCLDFEEEQPIQNFFEHYNKVKELMSFMSFRKNVMFDEIILTNYEERSKSVISTVDVNIIESDVFFNKCCYNNITFNDLRDSLPNLIKILYEKEDKKESILLGFLPSNDDNVNYIDNNKIKEICSAIECELNFSKKIGIEENKNLDELISIIKKQIKEFRSHNGEISERTYSLINSSLKYWSLSLADRIWCLCEFYERFILKLPFKDILITKERVQNFVKYRNDITHGRHRTINREVVLTAGLLTGLVYCCILKRIGVDEETIYKICESKILT